MKYFEDYRKKKKALNEKKKIKRIHKEIMEEFYEKNIEKLETKLMEEFHEDFLEAQEIIEE